MDIVAHALWSYIIFYKHPKRWLAVLFGVLPDIVTFLPHLFSEHFSGRQAIFDFIYQYTHSLFLFFIIFGLFWSFFGARSLFGAAWGVHIVFDIFTHPTSYYPTPFLFPFVSPEVLAFDYRGFGFLIVNYFFIILTITLIILCKRKLVFRREPFKNKEKNGEIV
jgi:hypothetical protein